MLRENSPGTGRMPRNPLASDPTIRAGVPNTEAAHVLAEAAQREIAARVRDGAQKPEPPPLALSHPLDSPEESATVQQKLRRAHEAQFPWFARWLRRVSRFPKTVYEFADSVDTRFRVIHSDEQSQSVYNNEVAASLNEQATWLNGIRNALKETNARLAYYEHFVPQLKRAKVDYDRHRADQLLREADEANLRAAPSRPVIPFDPNGVRAQQSGDDRSSFEPNTESEREHLIFPTSPLTNSPRTESPQLPQDDQADDEIGYTARRDASENPHCPSP